MLPVEFTMLAHTISFEKPRHVAKQVKHSCLEMLKCCFGTFDGFK